MDYLEKLYFRSMENQEVPQEEYEYDYDQLANSILDARERLNCELSDENKDIFELYVKSLNRMVEIEAARSYAEGMENGIRIAIAVLHE